MQRKKGAPVRDLGFKEHGDEFLGFLFVSYTQNLKVKKLVTQKCQYPQGRKKKKSPSKISSFQPREQKRTTQQDRKPLQDKCSLASNHRKKPWPHSHPLQQWLSREVRLLSSHTCNEAPQHPQQGNVKESKVWSQSFTVSR